MKPNHTRVASAYRYYKQKAFGWIDFVRNRETAKTQKRENRAFRMPSSESDRIKGDGFKSFESNQSKGDNSKSFRSKRFRIMSRIPQKESVLWFLCSRVAYYSLLEISPQASDEDIRKSFYRLARIYHPDKNHDKQMQVGIASEDHGKERFLQIKEAYDVLSDRVKRDQYDRNFSLFPLAVCCRAYVDYVHFRLRFEPNTQNRFTIWRVLFRVRVLKDIWSEGVGLPLVLPFRIRWSASYFIVGVERPDNGWREVFGFVTEELYSDPSLDGKENGGITIPNRIP